MAELIVDVPDELAHVLHTHREHLPALLLLGLEEWHKQESTHTKDDVEEILQQLAEERKLVRPQAKKSIKSRKQYSLVHIMGKPMSELVLEQRGPK